MSTNKSDTALLEKEIRKTSTTKGYAAASPTAPLAPFSFERRQPREHDVVIDIKFCGICHSDIHQTRDEWSEALEESIFPMVPGHEIVGIVTCFITLSIISLIVFKVIDMIIGNRVSAEAELQGLDIPEMGVMGYDHS